MEIERRDLRERAVQLGAVTRFECHHEGECGVWEAGLLQQGVDADTVFRKDR